MKSRKKRKEKLDDNVVVQELSQKAIQLATKLEDGIPRYIRRAIKCGPVIKLRDTSGIDNKDLTTGERVVRFIESEIYIPDGKLAGTLMKLGDWQKLFIISVFDNPKGTKRAILSIARKNGKTGIIAAILLAVMSMSIGGKNNQQVSAAMTREQAAILYAAMAKMVRMNPNLEKRYRVVDSRKTLTCITTGNWYRALAKDASGASTQGLSPLVCIVDELGQVVGAVDPYIDALTSSQGAHESPLFLAISTQAAADSDLMSMWIDDAIASDDPNSVVHVYESDKDCQLLDEEQWIYSNPGLVDGFRSYDDLRTQLERAARMPSAEASARNLLLNQRISLLTLAVSPAIWKANRGSIIDELFYTQDVHLGLDLSTRNDLTAAVAAVRDPETGKVHTKALCYTPLDGLADRARESRAPYELWVKTGELTALPGKHLDYDMLAEAMAEATKGMHIVSVQFDRYRINDFMPRAEANGLAVDAEWIACGQGYKDFALRIDGMESLLLQEKICHGGHPLLNMAAANAIVVSDPAGNRKLDKAKSSQKIDALVAMAMAVYPLSDGQVETIDTDLMII